MSLPDFVKVNAAMIASKVIDGEAMIMNVRSGIYYSLDGPGALIWKGIESGHGLENIVDAVVDHYDVEAERARADLAELVDKLMTEGIVLDGGDAVSDVGSLEPDLAQGSDYQAPELQTYRDMGDLLALDPLPPNAADLDWND